KVQPEIAEHRRVKAESHEIAGAEPCDGKEPGHRAEGEDEQDGGAQAPRIEEDMKLGMIGGEDRERDAANHNMASKEQREGVAPGKARKAGDEAHCDVSPLAPVDFR